MHVQLQKQFTWKDLLAMPADGVERWIVDGQLKEWHPPSGEERLMPVRNRFHSWTMARTSQVLLNWLDGQPEPHGRVVCGEAGVILIPDPETTVGIDLAYFIHEVILRQTDDTTMIVGVPLLAVEILSPSDTQESITAKRDLYRRVGVPLIWLIDPGDQTVRIYQAGTRPRMVAAGDELACEPHLPGFRVPVARLFA